MALFSMGPLSGKGSFNANEMLKQGVEEGVWWQATRNQISPPLRVTGSKSEGGRAPEKFSVDTIFINGPGTMCYFKDRLFGVCLAGGFARHRINS